MQGGEDDWYRKTFGAKEKGYNDTKAEFDLRGNCLVFLASDTSFNVGTFKDASLADLRQAVVPARPSGGRRYLEVKAVPGEVTALQADPQNRFATFQVSSPFNYLSLTGPNGKPEAGVTRYGKNPSQGAACAISCGAGAVYRNSFVPVRRADGSWQHGQTSERMLNGLAPLLEKLALPDDVAFQCRGGYTLADEPSLHAVNKALSDLAPGEAERLVKVGVHEDLQVPIAPSRVLTVTRTDACIATGPSQCPPQSQQTFHPQRCAVGRCPVVSAELKHKRLPRLPPPPVPCDANKSSSGRHVRGRAPCPSPNQAGARR